MKKAKWENILSLTFGAWLFITPWFLMENLSTELVGPASGNAWAVGFLIASFAAMALFDLRPWEEMVNFTIGMWLALSPWVLGYSVDRSLALNSVIVGFAVMILSGMALPIAQRVQIQKQKQL